MPEIMSSFRNFKTKTWRLCTMRVELAKTMKYYSIGRSDPNKKLDRGISCCDLDCFLSVNFIADQKKCSFFCLNGDL